MQQAKQLANLISRLNAGENPDAVRADFVKEFEHVSVAEIMEAEQALMDTGMAEEEIQKACDLHSALFHGKTEAEVFADELLEAQNPWLITVLNLENEQLSQLIQSLLKAKTYQETVPVLESLRDLKKHYAKKEELIMPILHEYGVTGPQTVMWGVDDEILRGLSRLNKTINAENFSEKKADLDALAKRMQEMIYKEQNILYPMAIKRFKKSDWLKTYGDVDEYGLAWIEKPEPWQDGEAYVASETWRPAQGILELPTGSMDMEQLEAMLKVLPMDLTYIDENNNLIFFTNEGHVFARPKSALGRSVFLCHPPRVVKIVEKMIDDFKSHRKDRVERWLPLPGKPVKVVYRALYDKDGTYKGIVETVQEFDKEGEILQNLTRSAAQED